MKSSRKWIYSFVYLMTVFIFGCDRTEKADIIFHNGKIYTLDNQFTIAEAMAVKEGKIIAIGPEREILNKYTADTIIDLRKFTVFPAWHDAHGHLTGMALQLLQCDLTGCRSIEEVIVRLKEYDRKNPGQSWLLGRGWDQNLWQDSEFPTAASLDSVFDKIPVFLTRIDGHAAWVNTKAMQLAGIDKNSKIEGGQILLDKNNKPTGILLDNAMELVKKIIPQPDEKTLSRALTAAAWQCLNHGVAYVHEAGATLQVIHLLDSLVQSGIIPLRVYAMAALNQENLYHFVKNGKIEKNGLKVRSMKIYADGALGSRGALLKKDYSDFPGHRGILIISADSLYSLCRLMDSIGFQVCTHAIGDSAVGLVLNAYGQVLQKVNDKRWRIEHAQIVDTADLKYFEKYSVIPSVQPTHLVSDKSWAVNRLSNDRLIFAYPYQSLLHTNGMLPLGTDFPVEDINPLKTYYAAVFRKNYSGNDTAFFQSQQLTKEQALRGMTIWPAIAAFWENETGSLEKGKNADFVVYDIDFTELKPENFFSTKLKSLYISGKEIPLKN